MRESPMEIKETAFYYGEIQRAPLERAPLLVSGSSKDL
jgi:hypothetical protein